MDPNLVLHWTDHAGERQAMPLTELQKEFKAFLAWRAQQIALTVTGGSPEHLLQDQDRGLSQWLASKPDARLRVREACADIAAQQAATVGHDERMAFEAWALKEWQGMRPPDAAWIGWQGKAATPPAVQAPVALKPPTDDQIAAALLATRPCPVTGVNFAWLREFARAVLAAAPPAVQAPIDMVLHCPKCGRQHIDAPESWTPWDGFQPDAKWDNPPHRSHLCHGCGHVWRPADVPTNGVAAVTTKGKADSAIATPTAVQTLTDEQIDALWKAPMSADWEHREFARAIERAHGIGAAAQGGEHE